jgi:dTDP-4-amino-4,6-dideoxygalactose transaminase
MDEPIPISRPDLGDEEAEAAAAVIRSGWVMQGPEVAAFEKELGAFVGAPHACVVSSGTAALHLALLACGVQPGDEVVTVSHSYIATANSVRHVGATPIFIDVEPRSFNMDATRIEAAITPRTRAILCVHQMGLPCDLAAICRIAAARGLRLVEDAACAVGSEICWQGAWERVGRPRGDLACFSFHPRKLLTTGDGGAVTTASAELDARVRRLRQHGSAGAGDRFSIVGYNHRMTDIQAAVGRVQLRRLPMLLAANRERAERYASLLATVPGVIAPSEPAWARTNWQSYCVRLPDHADPIRVAAALAERGIATRPGIMNAHEEPAYASAERRFPLPESERARARCLTLPLYPGLTVAAQERVVRALAACLDS